MSRRRVRAPGFVARGAVVLALAAVDWASVAAPQGGSSVPFRLLDAAVEIARRDHPAIDAARVRSEVDRLAARYVALAGPAAPAPARADAFRTLLFDEERFESVPELDSRETLHVDSVLASKRGNCLSLSLVALLVAEAAGAPLHGVAMPNHFFVRYDDGAFRRNLELTRRGAEITDDELRARMGASWRPDSIYLRNLAAEEVATVLLHNRGFVAMAREEKAEAEADFRSVVEKLPSLPEASRNLGVLLGESGRYAEALPCFDRALALYPADADALVNRALCRHALGDAGAALEDLEMALLVDPSRERAKDLRAAWRREARGRATAPLDAPPPGIEPGLQASYFRGIAFDERVTARVDRDLDFEWLDSPARGVPADRFSVRWEGLFRAPATGTYSLFLVANDGVRLALGGETVLENFTPQGNENWYGSADVRLEAGYHPLRVELFEDRGSARIICRVGVEGREEPLRLADHLFHAPPK